MDQPTLVEPTTSAATRATEPEVRAGIMSGDTPPDVPTHVGEAGGGFSWTKLGLLLAAGCALGYGASRLWRA